MGEIGKIKAASHGKQVQMKKIGALLAPLIAFLPLFRPPLQALETDALRLFMVWDGRQLRCEKIFDFDLPAQGRIVAPEIRPDAEGREWCLQGIDRESRILSTTRVDLRPAGLDRASENQDLADGLRFDAVLPASEMLLGVRLIRLLPARRAGDLPKLETVAECGLDGVPRTAVSQLVRGFPPIRNMARLSDWGPDKNRVTHVFLSSGYSEAELGTFRHRVDQFVRLSIGGWIDPWRQESVAGIFGAVPFRQFEKAFDIYVLDIPDFDADALLSLSERMDEQKALLDEYVRAFIPEPPDGYDIVYNSSGTVGGYPVGRLYSNTETQYVMHKWGHGLAYLAEESQVTSAALPVCPPPQAEDSAPNITIDPTPTTLKWRRWADDPAVPFPTPPVPTYRDSVGAFLGANRCPDYYFRPQAMCLMRALPASQRGLLLCRVCREELVIQMLTRHINLFDSTSSDWGASPIFADRQATIRAGVGFDEALYSCIVDPKIVWYLDGREMPEWGHGPDLSIAVASLPPGRHGIKIGVLGPWRGTEGFIRKNVDTNFYHSFPEFEIAKGKVVKKK